MDQLRFLDTTLRDGDQMPGVNLSVHQKREIALLLEKLGVDVIEAGFAAASVGESKAVSAVASAVRDCAVASLARTNEADIDAAVAALRGAAQPVIHTFIASSPIHMEYKLHMSEDEVLERAVRAVKYARRFAPEVEFSAEDASRSDREFLCRLISAVLEAGATVINVPDTVGFMMPEEYATLVKYLLERVDGLQNAILSVHCHNDLGLAVANTLAAVSVGARQVEGTINGIGERAGNAALEEIALCMTAKPERFPVTHRIQTPRIMQISRTVSSMTGVPLSPNKAIVGKNAFSHESGIHQHGVLQNPLTYEIFDPSLVGIQKNSLVLGKLSGRHAFISKVSSLGFACDQKVLNAAFTVFKSLAEKKSTVSDEEIAVIVQEQIDKVMLVDGYTVDSFQIQSGSAMKSTAMLALSRGGLTKSEAAIGDGPIDAAFNAINRVVGIDAELDSYDLRAVTEGTDALGVVTVHIRCFGLTYSGRGISMDIIEASIKAYVHAINRALYYTDRANEVKV